eukprot:8538431-Pyramimonas_sp.AAC.2
MGLGPCRCLQRFANATNNGNATLSEYHTLFKFSYTVFNDGNMDATDWVDKLSMDGVSVLNLTRESLGPGASEVRNISHSRDKFYIILTSATCFTLHNL